MPLLRNQLLGNSRIHPRDTRLVTTLFGEGLDPAVAAFAAESGATNLIGLNNLVVYLRAQSLYNNFVIYPMKSAQNAGSGSTVYSLGGLTDNDKTLVNSPSWGANGITFNGTTQYAHVADFIGAETITVFSRNTPVTATPVTGKWLFSQGSPAGADYSFAIYHSASGNQYILARSADGGVVNFEQYSSGINQIVGTDSTIVAQWVAGGGRSLWVNNTSKALTLITGSAQTSRFNSSANIDSMARANANFMNGLLTAEAYATGTITSSQRSTITDLINAL